MGLYLLPTSGLSVGGGGHDVTSPRPTGLDGPPDAKDSARELKLKVSRKRFAATPPGQLPGAPLSQSAGPYERLDWRFPTESLERTALKLIEDAVEPDATKQWHRQDLHKRAAFIRGKIGTLRQQLAKELEQAKHEREIDAAKNRGPNRATHRVLSDNPTIPKLPRATRPFVKQATEAQFIKLEPGTPLHTQRISDIKTSPTTQRILSLRAEISKLRMELVKIREGIKQIVGNRPIKHDIPMHAPSVTRATKAITNIRAGWLGKPHTQLAAPVGHSAQKLRARGFKPPRPHGESLQFNIFGRRSTLRLLA